MERVKENKHYRLSSDCLEAMNIIKKEQGLPSSTATIEFAVQFYLQHRKGVQELLDATRDQLHESRLIKKYLNQIRRDNYMTLDLLNAQCIQQSTLETPPHHLPRSQCNAYIRARDNLKVFLNDMAVKNKYGQQKIEGEELSQRVTSWLDFEDEIC